MIKVTIITPTIRKEGLTIVEKALKKQTFKNFEWIIGAPFDPGISWAKWIPDKFTGGYWSLNRCWDSLFDAAEGELIICLQDWIHIKSDGLQKFWDHYISTDRKGIITGVGNQFERMGKYKPEIMVWSDPRKNLSNGSFYELGNFNDIEFNWCAIPKQALIDIGGLDKKLDFLGFGADMLQVADRINDFGKYRFYIDQTNESFTIRHDRSDLGGENHWNKHHVLFKQDRGMSVYDRRKMDLKKTGQWPVFK